MGREDALIIFTGPSSRGWHRLQQAAECLQKYAYFYGVSSEPPSETSDKKFRPALAKGTLMHLALAQRYARIYQQQHGEDPETFEPPVDAVHVMGKAQQVRPDIVDLVVSVYEAYARRYEGEEEHMQIEGVERLYETTVRGKYLFTGRIDLLYRDDGGRLWACDHKTSARLTSSHKQYYAASGQLIGYQYLVRLTDSTLAGMKLNLIEVSDRPSFERITLPRAPHFEATFEQTLVDIEERIEQAQRADRQLDHWPKAMNEMTCYGRYGACPHLDRCRWGPEHGIAGNWTWSDQ